ncbi:pentapeptide repeat-containing protein [Helicobacter sp. 23-1046]
MAQNQYFSLQYNSQENLYVLSIDNISSFSISDIYEECNDTEVFSKGKNDEIIIHKPIKIKYNNKRKNIKIDFQRCIFKKRVYFTNCEFNGNVFFNHAVFHNYADFHESIFNGIVSFYNATFNSAPNFSTCVFANLQGTNFINVKMDNIDFKDIENFVERYKKDKYYDDKSKQDNEFKIRYASNARDSFRTIKNVLIENNNLLDASAWYKIELYAKEIELRLPKPHSKENPNNERKNYIDLIQLCFYRHTSEHHTDLLKILSWFIILVGSFATALFFEKDFFNEKIWWSIFWGILSVALCFSILFEKIKFFGFFTLLNLVPCAWLLTWNPKYIFGVANLFTNDKSQSDWFANLLMSIYSIFFILVIFSLQKTARKNSIIPN